MKILLWNYVVHCVDRNKIKAIEDRSCLTIK